MEPLHEGFYGRKTFLRMSNELIVQHFGISLKNSKRLIYLDFDYVFDLMVLMYFM